MVHADPNYKPWQEQPIEGRKMRLVLMIGTHQRWQYFIRHELDGIVYCDGVRRVVRTEDTEYRFISQHHHTMGLLPDEVRYLGGSEEMARVYEDVKRLVGLKR